MMCCRMTTPLLVSLLEICPTGLGEEWFEAAVGTCKVANEVFHTKFTLMAEQDMREKGKIMNTVSNWEARSQKSSLYLRKEHRGLGFRDVLIHTCFWEDHTRPSPWQWKSKIRGELGSFCAANRDFREWFLSDQDGNVKILLSEETDSDKQQIVFCRCHPLEGIDPISTWDCAQLPHLRQRRDAVEEPVHAAPTRGMTASCREAHGFAGHGSGDQEVGCHGGA